MRLGVVADIFMLTGRGLVAIFELEDLPKFGKHYIYSLIRPDKTIVSSIGYIESACGTNNCYRGINFPKLTKSDVPIGTEITFEEDK